MRLRRVMVMGAAAACLAFTGAASGQQPPAETTPDEVTIVEELVVRAYDGPAWWTVADADSKVYILAIQNAVPKGTAWDKTQLRRRLTGAKKLIMPVHGREPLPSPIDLLTILRYERGMRSKPPVLEGQLAGDLGRRFARLRTDIGQPAQRYGTFPAGPAAMLLAGDTYNRWYPSQKPPPLDGVEAMIEGEAKAKRVGRERPRYTGPVFGYNVMIADLLKTGPDCLSAIVATLEKGRPPTQGDPWAEFVASSRRWAEGDVGPVLRNAQIADSATPQMLINAQGYTIWIPQGAWNACSREMPNLQKNFMRANPVADTAAAIRRQLKQPGHAVAVVYPFPLLRRDGVLDRLRREGFTVTTPGT